MNKHEGYLMDLGFLLLEDAIESVESAKKARGTDDEAFEAGRSMAYFAVIDLMIQQAKVFEIPLESLRLQDADPYRDLLLRKDSDGQ